MKPILLATDGSEHAQQAAKQAIELAEEQGVPLYALCVVDKRRFDNPALSSAELATIYAEDHASMCVSKVADMAEESNVRVEGGIRHGIPHEVILEYAAEVDADAIVIGEHGDHTEHFSGVGGKVAELADRDVIVVRAQTV
ncbi:universal stress protein [Halogeometricum borinquense]|uniref:Universal stress protein n=1 Tax=Halogeometricum borinquense TaxID=60847 RepID=A0A6C0UQ55_9EURY|nr:universal stress protein [Halogeometricum borinquense]QIB76009.1 universal stress protein [Halogeometricum borinquense]